MNHLIFEVPYFPTQTSNMGLSESWASKFHALFMSIHVYHRFTESVPYESDKFRDMPYFQTHHTYISILYLHIYIYIHNHIEI